MKKLLVVMLVLAMAGMANAAMELSLSGTEVAPAASITINVSAPDVIDQMAYFIGIDAGSVGGGSFDLTNAVITYPGSPSEIGLGSEFAGDLGILADYVQILLSDTVEPIDPVTGSLVTGIKFVGGTAGDVTIKVFNANGELQGDGYTITVGSIVPEPITVALLGLGGLFLRRRK